MWEHGVAPGHYLCNGKQKKYTAMNQIQFITDVLREMSAHTVMWSLLTKHWAIEMDW